MFITTSPMNTGEIIGFSIFIFVLCVVFLICLFFLVRNFIFKKYDTEIIAPCVTYILLCLFFGLISSINIYYGIKINNAIITYFNIPKENYYNLEMSQKLELKYIMDKNLVNSVYK